MDEYNQVAGFLGGYDATGSAIIDDSLVIIVTLVLHHGQLDQRINGIDMLFTIEHK